MEKQHLSIVSTAGLFLLLLAACNMPGRRTPTPSAYQLINTAAAQTVMAQLTEISRPPAGTAAPFGTPVFGTPTMPGFGTQAPQPQTTPGNPTEPPQAGECDRARFGGDITIPDNTALSPGESFVKTWQLKNNGSCTWTSAYRVAYVSGDRLGAPDIVLLSKEVVPGETVEISINMVAPTVSGTYKSNWKLLNAAGQAFGTGSDGTKPFWAQIKVNAPSGSPSGLDLISSASRATWYSGANDASGDPLTFGGPLDDPAGAARIQDAVLLETGAQSGKVLITVPRQVDEGYVYGIFPAYTVQKGDRFKARLGFARNADGKCGSGRVVFQFAYQSGGQVEVLHELTATCNGQMDLVDISLAGLAGETVQFILAVRADGSPADDWAVWNSPRISQ